MSYLDRHDAVGEVDIEEWLNGHFPTSASVPLKAHLRHAVAGRKQVPYNLEVAPGAFGPMLRALLLAGGTDFRLVQLRGHGRYALELRDD